jgi:hypothetical protein
MFANISLNTEPNSKIFNGNNQGHIQLLKSRVDCLFNFKSYQPRNDTQMRVSESRLGPRSGSGPLNTRLEIPNQTTYQNLLHIKEVSVRIDILTA